MEQFGIDIPAGGTVVQLGQRSSRSSSGRSSPSCRPCSRSLRASRIPPLAALRDVVVGGIDPARPAPRHGAALTIRGAGAMVVGLAGSGIAWVGLGALDDLHRRVRARTAHRPPSRAGCWSPLPALSGHHWLAGPGERAAQPEAHRPHRRRADGRRRPRRRDHRHVGVAQGLDPRRLRGAVHRRLRRGHRHVRLRRHQSRSSPRSSTSSRRSPPRPASASGSRRVGTTTPSDEEYVVDRPRHRRRRSSTSA